MYGKQQRGQVKLVRAIYLRNDNAISYEENLIWSNVTSMICETIKYNTINHEVFAFKHQTKCKKIQ